MGTDVINSYDSLKEELNKAKNQLKDLNENIKRIVGRVPEQDKERNERSSDRKRNFNEINSSGSRRAINNKNTYDDIHVKIKREFSPSQSSKRNSSNEFNTQNASFVAKSVFSRLSDPPLKVEVESKPRMYSRVIRDLPTREEIVEAQCVDEQSKARHRRMFGSLLGTLQKFCQEENRLKTKEEKKALVEKKLEEQALREREKLRKDRQILFVDRKRQQLEVKKIESKLFLIKEFEAWEKTKKDLYNCIKTKSSPQIYYKPKKLNAKLEKCLADCRSELDKEIEKRRLQLHKDIIDLEDRFQLREDEMELISKRSEEQNAENESKNGEVTNKFERNLVNDRIIDEDCQKGNEVEEAEEAEETELMDEQDAEHASGSEDGEIRYVDGRKNVVITVTNNLVKTTKQNSHQMENNRNINGNDENDNSKLKSLIKIEKEND